MISTGSRGWHVQVGNIVVSHYTDVDWMMLSVALLSLHVAISGIIATAINSVQINPYMVSAKINFNEALLMILQDEIFHIPQAQQYCAYNFSHWDPMITTLPGL